MATLIEKFANSCKSCQLASSKGKVQKGKQIPSTEWSGPIQPFQRWGVDLIGKLSTSTKGHKWILTAVDYCTRWPVAIPLMETTAESIAEALYENIYMHYGCLSEILTDQGPNLWAEPMRVFMARLGTQRKSTTVYHPRINGMVERLNRTLGKAISKYLAGSPVKDWDLYLDKALMAARVTSHNTTGYSPFYLLYGVEPKLPTDDKGITPLEGEVRGYEMPLLGKAREEARKRSEARGQRNARYWDKDIEDGPKFQERDWVLLNNPMHKKWEAKWYGPYQILEVRPLNLFKLSDAKGNALEKLISGERLKCAVVEEKPQAFKYPNKRGRPINQKTQKQNRC
jgi:hypothetical protein